MKLNSDKRSKSWNIISIEIIQLKKKNNKLIDDLKRLNHELNEKIIVKPEMKKPINEEANIANEIECLKKMNKLCEQEIITLKTKIKIDTEPDRIVELQRDVEENVKEQNYLCKNIKELEKKIRSMDKTFEKAQESNEDNLKNSEVILIINKRDKFY